MKNQIKKARQFEDIEKPFGTIILIWKFEDIEKPFGTIILISIGIIYKNIQP